MEVQFGPNPVDAKSLIYKFQRKINVFNTDDPLPNRGYNLVASSSKYGLVFVGSPDGSLSTYLLHQLIDKQSEAPHLTIKLQEKPTHIAVSCDNELLAVTGGQLLCIYKVTDFQNSNVSPSLSLRTDINSATFVTAMQWNPCIPDSIVVVYYDGTLLTCQASTSQVKKVQSKGRCLCWSPKGKQFVTGNSDGTLTQFKPDLTAAKSIPAPKLFEGAPVEALAIYWISTFQFAVVYKNATDNSRPAMTIVNTPKAGQPSCLNYEDVCYSMGSRPWYYYLTGLAPWNLILASSSNSVEIATIASADGANWIQWSLSDEARAEIPLSDKKIENYPVGIWIDTSAIHQLPWGENDKLPYMPLLIVVSQSGLLATFNIINLNKQAPQLCTPPQQLTLPAAVLTTDIPGAVQAPAQPPVSSQQPSQLAQQLAQPVVQAAPKPPQPPPQQQQQPQAVQPTPTPAQPLSVFGSPSLGSFQQPAVTQAFGAGALPQQPEAKQPVEQKPAPPPSQPAAPAAPKPQPQLTPAQTAQAQEVYAAAKAEQEHLKAIKANQELKDMLVKEVNDFQMELYKFMVKTRDTQTKLQQDIDAINLNYPLQGMDAEQLRKECSLDELRGAIVQLKLELVRACAVVAEARTHAEAKDTHQWSQADPLTIQRVASIKKLAYYVQNQVDQAFKSLDYKWDQMDSKDPKTYKPGRRMIRPVLEDVYQPLVKQQEILCRQEAVLRTLKKTLKEVDAGPMFKSTSLLRSTPFKNKDPLSKLTKNILNMSIEPQTKPKEPLLSAQKLDALRDMLANHKTIKVKPVNVELRQQLQAMRIGYEKSLKDKAAQMKEQQDQLEAEVRQKQQEMLIAQAQIKQQEMLRAEAQFKLQQQMNEERMKQFAPPQQYAPPDIVKVEPKVEPAEPFPISVPTFTPVANSAKPAAPAPNNVVRTLFADVPESPKPVEASKPLPTQSLFASKPPSFSTQPPAQSPSATTRSVLKDLLQNKQANAAAKNDANTFMGQKICSPGAFSFGSSASPTEAPTSTEPPSYFAAKPPARVPDTKSIFGQAKPAQSAPNLKPSEEASNKTIEIKKDDKPITNMFGSKSILATLNKTTEQKPQELPKTEKQAPIKVIMKTAEKAKENTPEKIAESILLEAQKAEKKEQQKIEKKEPEIKPLGQQGLNFGGTITVTPTVTSTSEPPKPAEIKIESKPEPPKVDEKEVTSTTTPASPSASSLFATANASSPTTVKSQPLFGSTTPATTQTETVTTPTSASDTTENPTVFASAATSSASSVFSTAVASQESKSTQAGSIFNTSAPSTVFASTGSIFGSATATTTSSVFGTSTAASVFSGEIFNTPAATSFGATSTTQSVFASTPSVFAQATSTPSSVFASAASGPIFGTATTQTSVFGTATTTTSSFGTATTQASVFGSPTTTAQSLFGSAATQAFGSPATTTQSVFGSSTTTTPSVFGSTTTTQASVFGGTQSVFGSTPSTQASIFGSPNQTSVFGSAPSTQASVFGSAPATTAQSGGSLFGGAESNLFAAASISTTSAPSQNNSGGSIFGGRIFGGSSPGSVFGGGGSTNVFGGKASVSQANPTAASIFGGGDTFGQKQPQTNNFWSGGSNNTASTGFGSGFGQQPSTQASSIFGSATGGSFSTPSPAGQAFGSPQQAGFGTPENKPSVFGSPQQQAPAFGGSPVFGSKPAFGQAPGFGSPTSTGFGSFGGFNKSPSSGFGAPAAFGGGATFGGAPTFGSTSPGKMFGGSPGPAFGSPTQSNATFESLATQNTLTFGNLAQQSGQPQPQAAPSFNASPSFTGWRG